MTEDKVKPVDETVDTNQEEVQEESQEQEKKSYNRPAYKELYLDALEEIKNLKTKLLDKEYNTEEQLLPDGVLDCEFSRDYFENRKSDSKAKYELYALDIKNEYSTLYSKYIGEYLANIRYADNVSDVSERLAAKDKAEDWLNKMKDLINDYKSRFNQDFVHLITIK